MRPGQLLQVFAPPLILILAALYSVLVVCRAEDGNAEDWRRAADFVREHRQTAGLGDLIVTAPAWADPLGREYLGDQMSIEMAARMDAAGYARIWELSLDGERAPETRGLKASRSQRFGDLEVRLYEQEPARLSYDFRANWKRAAVSGQMQGRPNLSLEEVGFEAHRCIKVIPRPGQSVSMRFDAIPLGRSIVGYVGLADIFTRRDIREPGQLELLVDGKSLASLRAGVNSGWRRFEVATEAGEHSVEFRLSALGPNARDRRICFAAEARL